MTGAGTLTLWGVALLLGILAWRRVGSDAARSAVTASASRLLAILPRIVVALVAAGFVARLVPGETVAAWLGPQSGWRGVLLASVVGGFVPAGPIVSFPLVVVLAKAGAGLPQLVAFLTAWSVFAFHRVLIFETTLMGWRFSAVRLVSSLLLPPLAAGIVAGLVALVAIR